MKSIICNDRCCYVCGRTDDLHRHHIFYGNGKRKQSERFGAWVYLCPYHHNMSDEGVHFNKSLDLALKTYAQEELEKKMSREEFRKHFGASLL